MSKALEAAAREAFLHARTGGYGYVFADESARAFWEQAMARGITAYLRAVGEVEGVIFKRAETAITGALNSHHPRTRTGGAATALCAALSALEPKDD